MHNSAIQSYTQPMYSSKELYKTTYTKTAIDCYTATDSKSASM